ncbi:ribokinase [Rhodococcus sp. G-MC3]|uniref:ribokinase n=1 Tax=Rhodococcus sp. G-MC3 TaxID=3046209 RepID=UPI0024BBBF3F|nr:ribokinase [Rhodococcus sp. G-MC3]MDJ0394516.1 ribokinase [Rhodococcus sp. G-MC3]
MTTTRVTVLGSINMDLTTVAATLPRPGETVLGDTFSTSQGGKGANQAIAAARSGASTAFHGAVGDDAFADELAASLADAGVDTLHLRRVAGPSGIAAITVDHAGQNSIVVVAGANSSVDDLTDDELSTIADADILLCQLEIPMSTVVAGAAHAHAHGTLVMLNPSPVQVLPDDLVATVDVLVVNEAEAEAVGTDVLDRIDHVVTTLGAAGARYRGPTSSFDVRAPEVEAIDTTGAGDAFTGALAAEWFSGSEEALGWACAAGAFATTRRGAGSSSGMRSDIESILADTVKP